MREQFRNELLSELTELSDRTLAMVAYAFDKVCTHYDITLRTMDLVPIDFGFPNLCKYFIAAKKVDGLRQSTLESYMNILQMFFGDVRLMPEQVTVNDVRMWLYETGKKVSLSSLETYRIVVCIFFGWCMDEGYISRNPCSNINPIKYVPNERKALTQDQLELIRLACETPREKLLIEFLYSTGCRIFEADEVKLADIDMNTRTVHIPDGKGGKPRDVYLNAKCMIALKTYLKERDFESEYLFCSDREPHLQISTAGLAKSIRGISERSGVEFTAHILRHTTATQMVRSGAKVELIAGVLGHSNIQTTMTYAHVDSDSLHREHDRCVI